MIVDFFYHQPIMSLVSEFISQTSELQHRIDNLEQALSVSAAMLYNEQKYQESKDIEPLTFYTVFDIAKSSNEILFDSFYTEAGKHKRRRHESWAYALDVTLRLNNVNRAIKLLHLIHPKCIAQYSSNGRSIWRTVMDKCDLKTVIELIDHGLDPMISDDFKWNALFYAAFEHKLDIMKYLIQNYYNSDYPHDEDIHGNSLLQVARLRGNNEEIVEYLSLLL